ncbi:hypothetical protein BGX31_011223 [Mortierella sp. GBA43]|nr:hypothetical protein BGX31_011223 [Mortierella sp. GBA43]
MNFRPTTLRSLAHLRELLITSSTPPVTRSASPLSTGSTAVRSTSSSRLESPSSSRQRSAPRPPSRLSQSTLPDADPDIENLGQAESHQLPSAALDDESTEIYHSTVEHLALMTALVSVICWVMQTLLNTKAIGGVSGQTNPEGFDKGHLSSIGLNMDMFSGHDGSWNSGHHYSTLKGFLNLFDDQDNILKPISDALARRDDPRSQEHGMPIEMDPSKHVGLFAWHYYLFASDPDGPLVKEAQSISVHQLCSIEFDIILNELYTTHVLSKSVKEHQKDHGQFYTPPAVVDFMWKRATVSYENLLGRFVAITRSRHNQMMGTGGAKGQHLEAGIMTNDPLIPLIPTALDPCLGVSTFLSGYVRLLIHEAQHGHGGEIWNSETTARLLLRQICEHVWGIELDGFAFWMARCGILASMMPLVQRVQELSSMAQSFAQQEMFRYRNDESVYHLPRATTKLPRLHIFRNDTLQLTVPIGNSPETLWERECLLQLRNPSRLQFDFIVTNPPYMIRKTGTFSEADSEVYDWNILGSSSGSTSSAIGSKPRSKVVKVRSSDKPLFTVEERDLLMTSIGNEDAMDSVLAVATPESGISTGSTVSLRAEKPAAQIRSSAKGMMQAYGYFIWFAAQRVRPNTGVTCLITASQWLTLEFATKLRGWLFENCLMDEFFQFEPFKVFSRVQTDSLIFKIRRLDATRPERTLMEHRTVFLRHTDHHKPLSGVLQDYLDYFAMAHDPNNNNLDIMVSSRSRQELSVAIEAPTPTTSTSSSTSTTTTTGGASGNSWTYSFAPMMPTTGLATYLLSLTQGLGGICSAGTKKTSQMEAPEPLLWHRGPNTNPVYGLVVRMEYARASFGEMMTQRWFRQAFYWNGKNSPEETASSTAAGTSAKALHKEGMFWKNRDRLRLYKKEGSPAESYSISTPDPQRMYALCMVDKDSVKMLRQQVEQQVEGAEALWCYLEDVRNHFQPGLASKRRATSSRQGAEDDGIAYCSTNQNGSDVPEKIVHPINYGYFSKTQPRQRFFLDKDSMAMTNQCIYLTLNKHSQHYQARQSTPLIYFLTLLNSSTLQFFVLNHCLYDQQGRMRLFRDSMAKIPFQDWDVKNNHERSRYASRLGELMVELKDLVYKVVSSWYLGDGHVSSHGGLVVTHLSNHGLLDWIRRGGDAPTGVLARTREQVLRMLRTRIGAGGLTHSSSASQSSSPSMSSHIRSSNQSGASMADTDTDHSEETDDDIESDDEDGGYQTPRTTHDQTVEGQRNWGVVDEREYNVPGMGSTNVPQQHIPGGDHHRHSSTTTSTSDIPSTTSSLPSHSAASPVTPNMSSECDRIMQAIERAIAMIEIIQWAVDQYGYMLYGIRPSYQKMLELELKLVYGSIVESLVTSNSPVTEDGPLDRMASAESLLDNTTPQISGQASRTSKDQKRPWASPPTESHASRLGINVTGLYRWDDYGQVDEGEETDHSGSNVTSDGGQLNEPLTPTGLERTQIPSYAPSILANAQVAAQSLRELLERYAYNNRSQTERE